MSIKPIKAEVHALLVQANDKVHQAQHLLATGSDEARVRAAGELVYLNARKTELEARMLELDKAHDGVAPTVIQWVREDWMILMQRLESWIGSR
jgi:hypothetical protein